MLFISTLQKEHKQRTEINIPYVVLQYLCAFNYNKCLNCYKVVYYFGITLVRISQLCYDTACQEICCDSVIAATNTNLLHRSELCLQNYGL
ncbi:hypothetical protein WH47_01577 [Habropoda laboriosa]|uniref:Uncharacterized protein n=1 Tax=Habropoda laboriosa TaxID=597456 RepID=A0A0L7R0M8_9HYME|nr:hypothetical protein WH47_01577 [Habropoda laboriosa]